MRRILVTAISGDIGNGILKILHENNNNVLYGCDVNDIAIGMDMVQVFWKCKYAVEEGYIEQLLEKCSIYKITHIIPVNEREIEIISANRDAFENINVKLIIQSEKVLNICLDKYLTSKFLNQCGFDVPVTYLPSENIRYDGRKYICKPRKSNGAKNIFIFQTKEELINKDIDNYIIQEYIDSVNEYTVGIFNWQAVVNIIAFRRELKNGYSNKVELVHDEKICMIAQQLTNKISFEGYLNIQLKEKNGIYYIFEINPRISGTVRFRDMLGFHDLLWWLDIIDGKKVLKYKCKYLTAIGMRELNEKFLVMKKDTEI